MPGGNALLIGVGGSGRHCQTRLASFIAFYKCFSIEITKQQLHCSVIKQLMLVDRCWSIDVDMCQHAEEIVATCGHCEQRTRAVVVSHVATRWPPELCSVTEFVWLFFFVFCFYKIILHNWGTSIMPSWKTWRSSMSLLVWRIRSWLSCSQKLGQVTGYEQNIQFQWDLSHQFMRASLECSPKRMGTVSLYPDCVRSNPNHNQSPYLIYLLYIYLFTGILQYIDIYCTYLHIRTNHILISIHTGSG